MVNTKGWIDLTLPPQYVDQLNEPLGQGWDVDLMMPIPTGISGTAAVLFLLKREVREGEQR